MTGEAGSHEKPHSLVGMPPSGCQSHNPQEESQRRQSNSVPLLSCTCLFLWRKSLPMHTCAKHTNSYTAAHLWELLASTLFCISITFQVCYFKEGICSEVGKPIPWDQTTSKWLWGLSNRKSISWPGMSNQIVISPFPIPSDFWKLLY